MIKRLRSALGKPNLNNDDQIIINWNPLKRCILTLLLASGLNLLWLVWKTFVIFTPALHPFVNLDLVKLLIAINLLFIILLVALMYPCYVLQQHAKAQVFLPYLCVAVFAITLMYDSYMIGIMSPATMCGMISIVAGGLVLFDAKLVYRMLLPSLILMFYLIYQSVLGKIPYAPLFNLAAMQYMPYFNSFWLASMAFFITPIAISCFGLFSIILYQWREREKLFQNLSQIDPLTRLLNRRSINQHLTHLEAKPPPPDQYCSIILIDIDFFKNINDIYGHLKGDEVLSQVAEVMRENTRSEDLVGRYGGEEFVMIINHHDKDLVIQIAERCRNAIMNLTIETDLQPLKVTASFGIAFWKAQQGHIEQALHQADLAMYKAKAEGRNRVKVFQS